MTKYAELAVAEAMCAHYIENGLPQDGGRAAEQWTLVELGAIGLPLSNFQWRKRALPCHDLHHVLTGYPCDTVGELQIAAWEFAAGRFPSVQSTLFCLPLVGLGAVLSPARSFAAFVRGRRSRTLYGNPLTAELLALSVQELRTRLLPPTQPAATPGDVFRYLGLAALSLALMAVPVLVLWAAYISLG